MIKQSYRRNRLSDPMEDNGVHAPQPAAGRLMMNTLSSGKSLLGGKLPRRLEKFSAVLKGPLCLGLLALFTLRASADDVIDTFEGSDIASWEFYNEGSATGSLSLGPGHTGKGAVLSYDFSQGGGFVAAIKGLRTNPPITAAAVSLWLRSPTNITVRLQVIDSGGQTLQYTLGRPLTATDPNAWYQQVVALNGPDRDAWFGGASDGVVHGNIVQVRVLALEPLDGGPRDSLSFDDVTAISALDYTLKPSGTVIPGPARTGDLPSNLGVVIHLPESDAGLDAVRDAGFKWVRTDLFWSEVEKVEKGRYDWSTYDALVERLKARDLKALFILDYGNSFYTDGFLAEPLTPDAILAYANFAEAAALHFKGTGARFEIWNEGNYGDTFWNPEDYGIAAKETIASVHRGDLSAKVSTTGVAGFGFDYTRRFLNQGGGTNADAVAVHPYNIISPPNRLVENYLRLKEVIAPFYSSPPPIWNTEWGFSSANLTTASDENGHSELPRRRQAFLAARELLSCYAVGFPFSIYYDLRDDGDDVTAAEHNFGLLARDYVKKPAMLAVKTLTRFTRGRTFRGFLPTVPTSLVAMRFDGLNDKVVALWLSASGSSLTVTLPTGATATDALGAPLVVQNGRLLLREADGPVYITTR